MSFQTDVFIHATLLMARCKDDASTDMVNKLLELYAQDVKTHPEYDNNLGTAFVEILTKLKSTPVGKDGDLTRSQLILQFLTSEALNNDVVTKEVIKDIFDQVDKQGVNEETCCRFKRKVGNAITSHLFTTYIKKMYNKISACNSTSDEDKQSDYLNDITNIARTIVDHARQTAGVSTGAIERVDFSDKTSLKKALELYKEREITFKLKTGLQGLNQMLGKRGAFALGECVAFFALNHNFKSSMLLTVMRGLVRYNTPQMGGCDPDTKPLILFISLENEANRNVMWLYKHAYEQTFNKSAEGLTDDEIVDFVHEFYSQNGFHLVMERRDGNKFGFNEYTDLVETYENAGYKVFASLIDYANKMRKNLSGSKTVTKGNHNLVGELFSNLCTYHKTKGILFITAHQLNRDAQLIAADKQNVVKYFGSQHAADSIDVARELDLEIFMHLEKNSYGMRFLTMQRGKHRYVENTPEAHKYCAYRFTEYGIADDINGPPMFVRDIFAVEPEDSESGESAPSMDMDAMF